GAVERGDDADLARERRQRALARGVEQSFVLQPLLQLVEGELQGAEPMRLEMLAHQLVLALRLVDPHAPPRDRPQAVRRLELEIAQRRAEDDRSDLRRAALQGEIEMSGVPDAAVGELAFDPDFTKRLLEQVAHLNGELGDGEDASGLGGLGTGGLL